jgi:hypothetical protein
MLFEPLSSTFNMRNKSLIYRKQYCYGRFHTLPQRVELWLFKGERMYTIVLELVLVKVAGLELSDVINYIRLTS